MHSSSKWPRSPRAAGALAAAALAALAAPAQAQTHVDNPFLGASMYVNPEFTARADGSAAAADPQLAPLMRQVGRYPTAVWLQRVDAVPSLATHLDRALAAGNDLAVFVLDDIPGRDCDALVFHGELLPNSDGLASYQTYFIDRIAAIAAQPKYAGIRIVFVVEPHALANLVANPSTPTCVEVRSSGVYTSAVQYAVNTLHAIPNVYLYLDVAHAGWLGWATNATAVVTLLGSVSNGFTMGKNAVDGFATNVSDFVPVREPYFTATTIVAGQPVYSAKFYQYNSDLDDATFAADLWARLTAAGWPATIGMLADTSRNGWGGTARPTGPSPATFDLEKFVNDSRVDRRTTRSAWCNPSGAGLGARPQAAPAGYAASHYDAFFWVKTPGLSDGSASSEPWCTPDWQTPEIVTTGALPGAPEAGEWFPAQFAQLVQNMYPPSSQPVSFPLTVEPPGYGTVTSTPAGIDCAAQSCTASFPAGTSVTLTATPSTDWIPFVSWTGACAGITTPTCVVSMTQAQAVGTYWGSLYTLAVSTAGAGAGAVRSTPGGIDCGTSCSASYGLYTAVTLTATASPGSSFAGWSGACLGASPTCTVSMTAAKQVTATFQPGAWYPLTVVVNESGICNPPPGCVPGGGCPAVCYGGNAVTSAPAGIGCGNGGACSAAFASGTSVTLTAVPYNQNLFAGWVGACAGSTARTCVLPVTQAQTVTARFLGASNSRLHVSTSGTGAGTVTGWAGAIDCGKVCDVAFTAGTVVTLTATAAAGSTFTGWTGACSGTAPTCAVAVTGDPSVGAIFSSSIPVTFRLTVTKAGLGTGTVTSMPAGIQCGATCSADFTGGSSVTLTATPASGSVFAGWGAPCSPATASTCVVLMSQASSVTASFGGPNPIFTVTRSGTGAGRVVSTPAGIDCGSTCTASLPGRTVTLTATAAAGSTFAGWSGGCTGTAATCVLTADPLTQRASAGAAFALAPVTTPCANPIPFSWNTGNFNTTSAVCYRTSQRVNGWGCSSFTGRTVQVNGGAASAACGAGPLPLAKWSDGSTYFSVSAGQYPWASLYVW